MKHWNWLSEDTATFPYPRNSKPGQMPFGKGCFNHIQSLSLSTEKTKKKNRAILREARWCILGLMISKHINTEQKFCCYIPKIVFTVLLPNIQTFSIISPDLIL